MIAVIRPAGGTPMLLHNPIASMNKLLVTGLACWCLVFGAGCATPFTPAAVNSDYYVQEVGPKSFLLYYVGNGPASEERVVDFALLRACHLARERKCRYFAVVNQTLSGSERVVYDTETSDIVLEPNRSLAIKCFSSRPKGIFVFEAGNLDAIIRQKYRPGQRGARR